MMRRGSCTRPDERKAEVRASPRIKVTSIRPGPARWKSAADLTHGNADARRVIGATLRRLPMTLRTDRRFRVPTAVVAFALVLAAACTPKPVTYGLPQLAALPVGAASVTD